MPPLLGVMFEFPCQLYKLYTDILWFLPQTAISGKCGSSEYWNSTKAWETWDIKFSFQNQRLKKWDMYNQNASQPIALSDLPPLSFLFSSVLAMSNCYTQLNDRRQFSLNCERVHFVDLSFVFSTQGLTSVGAYLAQDPSISLQRSLYLD